MQSKVFLQTIICLPIVLFIASCQQEVITPNVPNAVTSQNNQEDSVSNTTNTSNNFFAKVDGVVFQETLLWASQSQMTDRISITASENASFPSIGLEFPKDIEVGTYSFTGYLGNYRGLFNLGTEYEDLFYAEGGSGNIVITNHDTASHFIEGTFSFTAVPTDNTMTTPTYEITEGAFSVSY